jgi:hypothetical protein
MKIKTLMRAGSNNIIGLGKELHFEKSGFVQRKIHIGFVEEDDDDDEALKGKMQAVSMSERSYE